MNRILTYNDRCELDMIEERERTKRKAELQAFLEGRGFDEGINGLSDRMKRRIGVMA